MEAHQCYSILGFLRKTLKLFYSLTFFHISSRLEDLPSQSTVRQNLNLKLIHTIAWNAY